MDTKALKDKLMKEEIFIADLSNTEVRLLIDQIKIDISNKYNELEELNKKIRNLKTKIDNWGSQS